MRSFLQRLGLLERELCLLGDRLSPSTVAEILSYHADSRQRRRSALIRVLRFVFLLLPVVFVFGTPAYYLALQGLLQVPVSRVPLPPVFTLAAVGAGVAFIGLFVRTPAHMEVYPAEEESQDFFYLASGWSALEKYVAWILADFVPFLQLWLAVGATVLLYSLTGALIPRLELNAFSSGTASTGQFPVVGGYGPPEPGYSLIPVFLVGWLFFAVSVFLFHLLVSLFPLHIANSGARNRLAGLLVFLHSLPVFWLIEESMEADLNSLREAGSLGMGTLSVWPVLVLLGIVLFGLVYRAFTEKYGSQVLLAAFWLIPGWAAVALVLGGSVLMLQGVEATADVPLGLTVPPALTLIGAYLLFNPFVALTAFLTTENLSSLYLTSPFLETISNPQAYGNGVEVYTEPVLILTTLLAIVGLFIHGYLAFRNRGRGLKPWE